MKSKFSKEIKQLLEQLAAHPLTLSNLLTETSERGFSLVIGLLVLPFLLPMPPGLTTVFGSACLILSVQMAIGRRKPWLPRRIAQFRFPKPLTFQLLTNFRRITRVVEKIAFPRYSRIVEHPYVWQINGACISWLTLLLMSPIPLTNPIPTIGILLFVVSTLEADGLLLCISYLFTVLITAGFGFLIYLLWRSPTVIENLVQSLQPQFYF